MQPDSQHNDVSRDPILDGRDSLRLVKLRLALTLIAVAVLPIAAVSPLVRAVAEEARMAHHERLVDQAQTAAHEVEREVAGFRDQTSELLDDPAMVDAAAQDASAGDRRVASNRLTATFGATDGVVVAAALITGKGVRAEYGPTVDLRELPAGVLVGGLASLPGDPARILVVSTSAKGAGPAGRSSRRSRFPPSSPPPPRRWSSPVASSTSPMPPASPWARRADHSTRAPCPARSSISRP